MNSIWVATAVFLCTFGGALVGILLQRVLPQSHLGAESKDVVKLGTGLVATMAALVLGLLVSAAKTSFNSQVDGFHQLSTNAILLDRVLRHFGPDADEARQHLRDVVATMIESLWPSHASQSADMNDPEITKAAGSLYRSIHALSPSDETQRSLQSQALQVSAELGRTRSQLGQTNESSLPMPFLVVLAFWLFVLFASFGLFAPMNGTVMTILLVCALSVAGAVFLIVDLDQPFEGLLHVSSDSLRNALAQMER